MNIIGDKVEFNGKMGVWRTIGGRRIFISDGQSLPEAMRVSGKFPNTKSIVPKLPYRDVTDKWRANAKPTTGKIEYMDNCISFNGTVVANADGKLKTIDPDEARIGEWFKNNFWGNCKMQPGIDWPQRLRSADIRLFGNCPLVKEQTIEIKTIKDAKRINALDKQVEKAHGQSSNILIDVTGSIFNDEAIWNQVKRTMKTRSWVELIMVKRDDSLLFVLKKK